MLADGDQVFDDDAVIAASPINEPPDYFDMGPTKESSTTAPSQFSTPSIGLSSNPTTGVLVGMEERPVYGSSTSLYAAMDSVFQAPSSQRSIFNIPSGSAPQDDEEECHFEVMFLIRHFAEVVAPWFVIS